MPKLDYTNDLRELDGQTNTASSLTDNLGDVQTRGRALDWENVVPHSLNEGHVYDPGTEPLKDAGYTRAAGVNITLNATWTTLATVNLSNLVSGASWIYVMFGSQIAAGAAGDTHQLRLQVDGGTVTTVHIGESSVVYGGGYGVWALAATATTHALVLQGHISAGATKVANDSFVTAIVVHR